jgi:nicotinamide phosphoribosyltransferase
MKLRPTEHPPIHLAPQPYNLLADTDSYKLGHWLVYRRGATSVYSYIESRGGRYPMVMLAAFQRLLYEKLGQPITREMVAEMAEFTPAHGLPFNKDGWDIILNEYGGRLPLLIKAAPEGLMIPIRNALISVENLDPRLPWLTSYFETMILRDVWTAATIAARVFYIAQRIKENWDKNSDTPMSPFAFLDFSSRGTMGYDHSVLAGIAHLFHFQGSDNVPAVRAANYYYFSDMAAWSVIATEHSISSSFGYGNDDDYIDHCIAQTPEGGILSMVGDTWDIFRFTQKLVQRKDILINKRITPVDRPDSGELEDVLPEVLNILDNGFGSAINSKGRRVINLGAKVLQGDGMNENTHMEPFFLASRLGLAPDSVMTAAGGGMATGDLDRDTNKWAMKCSEQVVDGERIDIYKDPVTDPGKKSKKGRFALIRDDAGAFKTINRINDVEDARDLLQPVFHMGDVVNAATLDQIRERVAAQL